MRCAWRGNIGSADRLVITDVVMPLMGGKVMAEWLKTNYPGIKVIFTSGYTDATIAHHGMLETGAEFLSKPYTPATLARKVREVLDHRTFRNRTRRRKPLASRKSPDEAKTPGN